MSLHHTSKQHLMVRDVLPICRRSGIMVAAKVREKAPVWANVTDRNKCFVVEGDQICGTLLKGKSKLTLTRYRRAPPPKEKLNPGQAA